MLTPSMDELKWIWSLQKNHTESNRSSSDTSRLFTSASLNQQNQISFHVWFFQTLFSCVHRLSDQLAGIVLQQETGDFPTIWEQTWHLFCMHAISPHQLQRQHPPLEPPASLLHCHKSAPSHPTHSHVPPSIPLHALLRHRDEERGEERRGGEVERWRGGAQWGVRGWPTEAVEWRP